MALFRLLFQRYASALLLSTAPRKFIKATKKRSLFCIKTAPASCYGNRGGSFALFVLLGHSHKTLRGFLIAAWGAGAKITERSGITYTDLYSFLWLRIIVHSSVALATLLFHQDPDTLFSHLYCTDQAYP